MPNPAEALDALVSMVSGFVPFAAALAVGLVLFRELSR